MPLVKPNEPLPAKLPIILLHGDIGVSKTSIGNTSLEPINLDFDRGIQRSILRKDTLVPANWEEVMEHEAKGTFVPFKTLVIDTVKGCLDDYLMPYAIRLDYKYQFNKLGAYGEIGDQFKLFTNKLREQNKYILMIAHSKKDEDNKKQIPDITGQSYSLVARIADQIGYVTIVNGQRMIKWNPSDQAVGKNTARLPDTVVPDMKDSAFRTFMGDIFKQVEEAMAAMTEEQREAVERSEKFQEDIAKVEEPINLTLLSTLVQELPDYLKFPLREVIVQKAKAKNWKWNGESKEYYDANTDAVPPIPPVTDPKADSSLFATGDSTKKQEGATKGQGRGTGKTTAKGGVNV